MKLRTASMFMAAALVGTLGMAACAPQNSTQPEQEAPVPEQGTPVSQDDVSSSEAPATDTERISEEEAKQIAFDDAGVTEQEVTLLTVNLDTDDGVTTYDVSFNVGTTEYDYEIEPVTGAVLERSAEVDD